MNRLNDMSCDNDGPNDFVVVDDAAYIRVDKEGRVYIEYYTSSEIGNEGLPIDLFAHAHVNESAGLVDDNISLAVRMPLDSIINAQIDYVMRGDGTISNEEKPVFDNVRAKLVDLIAQIDELTFKD